MSQAEAGLPVRPLVGMNLVASAELAQQAPDQPQDQQPEAAPKKPDAFSRILN